MNVKKVDDCFTLHFNMGTLQEAGFKLFIYNNISNSTSSQNRYQYYKTTKIVYSGCTNK